MCSKYFGQAISQDFVICQMIILAMLFFLENSDIFSEQYLTWFTLQATHVVAFEYIVCILSMIIN